MFCDLWRMKLTKTQRPATGDHRRTKKRRKVRRCSSRPRRSPYRSAQARASSFRRCSLPHARTCVLRSGGRYPFVLAREVFTSILAGLERSSSLSVVLIRALSIDDFDDADTHVAASSISMPLIDMVLARLTMLSNLASVNGTPSRTRKH